MKIKLLFNYIKYSLSFVRLSKYDTLSNDLDYQRQECLKKEENIKKIKKQLNDSEEYRKKQEFESKKKEQEQFLTIEDLKQKNEILKSKIKVFSGKIGGLTYKKIKLENELNKKNVELEKAKKELKVRPRVNLQSLKNYHENRK